MTQAEQEARNFFKQLDAQIEAKEEKKNKNALKDIVKREKEQDTNILDYCKEHNLDNKVAKEIRDTKLVLDEADKLDINNPLECMLYNQLMAGLDGAY